MKLSSLLLLYSAALATAHNLIRTRHISRNRAGNDSGKLDLQIRDEWYITHILEGDHLLGDAFMGERIGANWLLDFYTFLRNEVERSTPIVEKSQPEPELQSRYITDDDGESTDECLMSGGKL
jgi:hypothetical protein